MDTPLKLNTVQRFPKRLTREMFGDDGDYARLGVIGEGSCLFHSLLAATNLYGYNALNRKERQKIALALRCAFQQSFERERASFRGSDEQHQTLVETFCSLTSDAEEPQIRHVIQALGINILFFDLTGRRMFCGVRGEAHQPTIVICWVERRHFEPLVRIVGKDKAVGIFLPQNARDEAILGHLRSYYTRECSESWKAFLSSK